MNGKCKSNSILSLSLSLSLFLSLSLSAKLRTLQEIDEQISNSLHDEQDIEKEIDESSKFALYISKHRNRMQLWLKSLKLKLKLPKI